MFSLDWLLSLGGDAHNYSHPARHLLQIFRNEFQTILFTKRNSRPRRR
jgi:hypothetical protein